MSVYTGPEVISNVDMNEAVGNQCFSHLAFPVQTALLQVFVMRFGSA